MQGQEREGDLLTARIADALDRSRRGMLATLPFLTPRDCRRARDFLRMSGESERAVFWGGYPNAERACLFLLPDYLAQMREGEDLSLGESAQLPEWLREEAEDVVCAVLVSGSGFRELTHRDYLGSVLGLGLERDALGDIAVQNAHSAVIFCSRNLVDFLCENLCKVATDKVRTVPYRPDEKFTDGRKYARERAQNAIGAGLVEVEFEPVLRTDLQLSPPQTLSVRGYGRYILRAFDGQTRKGRLRLVADRLI